MNIHPTHVINNDCVIKLHGTTQFYGFGNGRFGHPSQDRALSLREGALLQGFPKNYEFVSDSEDISFKNVGRMIGNAVPVPLARAIARSVHNHLAECGTEAVNV